VLPTQQRQQRAVSLHRSPWGCLHEKAWLPLGCAHAATSGRLAPQQGLRSCCCCCCCCCCAPRGPGTQSRRSGWRPGGAAGTAVGPSGPMVLLLRLLPGLLLMPPHLPPPPTLLLKAPLPQTGTVACEGDSATGASQARLQLITGHRSPDDEGCLREGWHTAAVLAAAARLVRVGCTRPVTCAAHGAGSRDKRAVQLLVSMV
jgi:hypothetical protein